MQSILSDFGTLGVSWRQRYADDALQTTSVINDLAAISTSLDTASAVLSDTATRALDPLPALFQHVAANAGQDMQTITQQVFVLGWMKCRTPFFRADACYDSMLWRYRASQAGFIKRCSRPLTPSINLLQGWAQRW